MFQDLLNNNGKLRATDGYTLIEIAVSILIFSIVVLSLSLPFCSSMALSVKDQSIVSAANLARLYFKNTEINWQLQSNYDLGILPAVSATYNNGNAYNVTASTQNLATNSSGNIMIRRVDITYKDLHGNLLGDFFTDFNRPGS